MKPLHRFPLSDPEVFKYRLLRWAQQYSEVFFLDSNRYPSDRYHAYEAIVGVGSEESLRVGAGDAFDQLKAFCGKHRGWKLGFFSYDLKNEVERLSSANTDFIGMPDLHFIVPQALFLLQRDCVFIQAETYPEAMGWMQSIRKNDTPPLEPRALQDKPKSRMPRQDYLDRVHRIKEHIVEGDVYELNFCQEFYLQDRPIDPVATFEHLNDISRAPFSAFVRVDDKYLLCASPERFLGKRGDKLFSQPIKGTMRRGRTTEEDEQLKQELSLSAKDRAENVMIVDLVRNDLTRSSRTGSIQVEELFGIYGFKQVNQMISTVSSSLRSDVNPIDAIRYAFPMGSMTGAPKVRAMQLIEEYEQNRRGLFSGSVGYITPRGDFDFNVVIRSILHNASTRYTSIQAGGAITHLSDPQQEYDECLLKARAMVVSIK